MAVNFASQLNSAVAREDGIAVSRLLSVTYSDLSGLATSTNAAMAERDLGRLISDRLWANVVIEFWRVAVQVTIEQDPVEAFSAQNTVLTVANRVAEKADNWVLPVLCTIAKELRQLSILAEGHSGSRDKLEEATRTINRSFTICLNDRNLKIELSKKWGVYFFVGELFKVYFKLNKHPLAKSVIKVLQSMTKDLPQLKEYPKAHVVTYLYYWGVLLFIDQDYERAEEKLTEALDLCYHKSARNKEQILIYLVPAMLINKQKLPSQQLLKSNSKLQLLYGDIIAALKMGHHAKFDALVEERRKVLIGKFLYSAMLHLRVLTSCLLIRQVYNVENSTNRLDVKKISKALDTSGYFEADFELDDDDDDEDEKSGGSDGKLNYDSEDRLDEAECVVATLITQGLVKGYISHERRIVVLSNNAPFPRLA